MLSTFSCEIFLITPLKLIFMAYYPKKDPFLMRPISAWPKGLSVDRSETRRRFWEMISCTNGRISLLKIRSKMRKRFLSQLK